MTTGGAVRRQLLALLLAAAVCVPTLSVVLGDSQTLPSLLLLALALVVAVAPDALAGLVAGPQYGMGRIGVTMLTRMFLAASLALVALSRGVVLEPALAFAAVVYYGAALAAEAWVSAVAARGQSFQSLDRTH